MRLDKALFSEPWRAYKVVGEYADNWEEFASWELEPIPGETLAAENFEGDFQGLFIISANTVSKDAPLEACYLDLTLPERVSEHHFLKSGSSIVRQQGKTAPSGTVIPAIAIESFGNYRLFYARENPSVGINLLRSAVRSAHHSCYVALDLAFLLRDEKKYQEAIDAITTFLSGHPPSHLVPTAYQERARMYRALGESSKAEADQREYAAAFQGQFGYPPGS